MNITRCHNLLTIRSTQLTMFLSVINHNFGLAYVAANARIKNEMRFNMFFHDDRGVSLIVKL
jgi:hypothetical protein